MGQFSWKTSDTKRAITKCAVKPRALALGI
jgi:hypothetical protein